MADLRSVAPEPPFEARGFTLATVAITLLALGVRVWQATRTELWFDEIYTLWIARLDWPGLFRAVAHDVHPPAHFATIKLWRAMGGEASLWIKLSSVLPGVALVAAIAPLGRSLFGARAGLLAALLLALHGTHVMMSQEARAYAWLALWVWLAVGCAFRWLRDARASDAIVVIVAEALGLWTHYLSGMVFACMFGVGVIVLRSHRVRLAHWIGLHLAVAALFAPQLHTFVQQTRRDTGAHWIHHATWASLYSLARHAAFGSALLLIPFAWLVALPFVRARTRLAASWIATPLVVVTAVTFAVTRMGGHLYTERYMFWVIPGLCLLVAAGLAGLGSRALRWGFMLIFLTQGVRVIVETPDTEPVHLAAAQRWLAHHMAPDDALMCADTHSLFYLRQHAPALPAATLLCPNGAPPYYEGSELIPPAWLRSPATPDSLARVHVHWWGVRTEHGGADSGPAARAMQRAGGRVVFASGVTTVFEGPVAAPGP